MIASLFFGERGGARLLEADQGSHDDGVRVEARLETVPAGPGLGAEAIFTSLFIGTTSNVSALVDVTPIISGENEDHTPFETELETQSIELTESDERMSVVHQLGLSIPLTIGGLERARFAPRGSWFRARIRALVHSGGDLIFEGLGVEMEVVRQSTQAPTPTLAVS